MDVHLVTGRQYRKCCSLQSLEKVFCMVVRRVVAIPHFLKNILELKDVLELRQFGMTPLPVGLLLDWSFHSSGGLCRRILIDMRGLLLLGSN